NPFVRSSFGGYLVPLRGERKWVQLYNPNDRAFSAEIRIPNDYKFAVVYTPFEKAFINHDAIEYITHEHAIAGLWYDVVTTKSRARAFRPITQALRAFDETLTVAARDRAGALRAPSRLPPNRRALLVGINNYPDPANQLEGCINDVFLISAALQ